MKVVHGSPATTESPNVAMILSALPKFKLSKLASRMSRMQVLLSRIRHSSSVGAVIFANKFQGTSCSGAGLCRCFPPTPALPMSTENWHTIAASSRSPVVCLPIWVLITIERVQERRFPRSRHPEDACERCFPGGPPSRIHPLPSVFARM